MESLDRISKAGDIELNLAESELSAFSDSGISKDLLCDTKKLASNLDLSAVLIKIQTPNFTWKLNEPWQLLLFSGEREALEGLSTKLDWVKLRSDDGFTPVHYAAMSGDSEILNWICGQLGEHARVLLMDKAYYGDTVLDIATASGSVELLRWLCKTLRDDAKALLKKKDILGQTVLHHAVDSGKVEVLSWLCQYLGEDAKALLKQKDNDGLTVLNYAAAKNQASFDRLVLSYPEAAHKIIRPPIKEGGLLGIGSTLRPRPVLTNFKAPLEALLQQSMQELILKGYQEDLARLLFVFREESGVLIENKTTQAILIKAIENSQDKDCANRNYQRLKFVKEIQLTHEQQIALLTKLEVPQSDSENQANSQSEADSQSKQPEEEIQLLTQAIETLNSQLADKQVEKDALLQRSSITQEVKSARIEKLEAEIEVITDELTAKTTELTVLKETHRALKESHEKDAKQSVDKQSCDSVSLAITITTFSERLEAKQTEIIQQGDTIQALESANLEKETELKQLREQLAELKKEKNSALQLSNTQSKVEKLEEEITELINRIKSLEGKLSEKQKELSYLQQALAITKQAHAKDSQLLSDLQIKHAELTLATEARIKAKAAHGRKVAELEKKLQQEHQRYSQHDIALEEAESKVLKACEAIAEKALKTEKTQASLQTKQSSQHDAGSETQQDEGMEPITLSFIAFSENESDGTQHYSGNSVTQIQQQTNNIHHHHHYKEPRPGEASTPQKDTVSADEQPVQQTNRFEQVDRKVTQSVIEERSILEIVTLLNETKPQSQSDWQERGQALGDLANEYDAMRQEANVSPDSQEELKEMAREAREKRVEILADQQTNPNFAKQLKFWGRHPERKMGSTRVSHIALQVGDASPHSDFQPA